MRKNASIACDLIIKERALSAATATSQPGLLTRTPTWQVVAAWLAVGIPMAWGVWVTVQKAAILFGF
jgi:hypothetical protein